MASDVRLLVTGDREWSDIDLIRKKISSLHPGVVIEGEAPGADTCAAFVAEELGISLESYPAYWNCQIYEEETGYPCKLADGRHEVVHGRPAGVIRNQRMLDEAKPTMVYAFHDDLDNSKGTADMVRRSRKASLEVHHFSHDFEDGVVL